jgi:hypothetical protein
LRSLADALCRPTRRGEGGVLVLVLLVLVVVSAVRGAAKVPVKVLDLGGQPFEQVGFSLRGGLGLCQFVCVVLAV